MHMQAGRGELGDGDLTGPVLPRQPAGEDPGNVQLAAEPAVQRGLGDRGQLQPASRSDRLDIQAHHRGDPAHPPQPGQRQVVAAQAGAGRGHQQVGGVRRAQEARVGAAGPPRPCGGGQDRATRERDQQDEHRPAPPPGSELIRHEEQHHTHQAAPPSGSAHHKQSGLRPPCTERRHFGGDPPGCSRRRRGCGRYHHGRGAHPLCGRAGNRGPMDGNARGRGGMALAAGWMCFRAELRRRWRAWLALALIVGAFAGVVEAAAAGARRTDAAYPALLAWSDAPDVLLFSFPGQSGTFGQFSPAAAAGLPQALESAIIASYQVATPAAADLVAPESTARYRGGSGAAGSWPAGCPTRPGPARSTSPSPWPRPSTWASGRPAPHEAADRGRHAAAVQVPGRRDRRGAR